MMKSNEPKEITEIHEIREKIQNENKNLSLIERAAKTNTIGNQLAKGYGLKVRQRVG